MIVKPSPTKEYKIEVHWNLSRKKNTYVLNSLYSVYKQNTFKREVSMHN